MAILSSYTSEEEKGVREATCKAKKKLAKKVVVITLPMRGYIRNWK